MKKQISFPLFSLLAAVSLTAVTGCQGKTKETAPDRVVFQSEEEIKTVAAKGDGLIRSYYYPTTQSDVFRIVESGETIRVAGVNSDWVCMEENGSRYYILSKELEMTDAGADGTAGPGAADNPDTGKSGENGADAAGAAGDTQSETAQAETTQPETTQPETESEPIREELVSLRSDMKYAEYSVISDGKARLYGNHQANRKGITVCVNAGHGTKGGSSVKTQCHPDGTPKVTGGTTQAGATKAVAVSSGMTFSDGTPEANVTLRAAIKLRDKLLAKGYSVLMIRESDDVQLDNVARTVLANTYADCHVALHWDSTENNKGAFYMAVPSVESYRSMEPVASTWKKSERFGGCLVDGLRDAGRKIYGEGRMEMDLTQTSYSRIPSIDIELGDKASDHSDDSLNQIADGLLKGIELYFEG